MDIVKHNLNIFGYFDYFYDQEQECVAEEIFMKNFNFYYIITCIIGLLAIIQDTHFNRGIGIILLSMWAGVLSIELYYARRKIK